MDVYPAFLDVHPCFSDVPYIFGHFYFWIDPLINLDVNTLKKEVYHAVIFKI